MRHINKDNLADLFDIMEASVQVPDIEDRASAEPPYLLRKYNCGDDYVVATFKRTERTRKLRVLSFEEWTNGKFLRCVADFKHESEKATRKYNPRESLNRVSDVIAIEGSLSSLFPEKDDFRTEEIEPNDQWYGVISSTID